MRSTPLIAARQIMLHQGLMGFYAGVGPPLATVALFNAVLFSVNGTLTRIVKGWSNGQSDRELTTREVAVVGALSGIPVGLLATPTELLKCRLQAQGDRSPPPNVKYTLQDAKANRILYRGPVDALKSVIRLEGGAAALFHGLSATMWREVLGNGMYFATYAVLKKKLTELEGLESTKDLHGSRLMLCGAVAGLAFWVPMLPLDVIKTKMQTDSLLNPSYRGMIDCGRRIIAKEGIQGLFRGALPCWARSLPANGATFAVFDLIKNYLDGGTS